MKKGTLLCLLLAASVSSFCQQTKPVPAFSKQYYLQKSKAQKTAAWILLTGGIVMESIGIIVAAAYPCEICGQVKPPPYTAFIIIGGAMMAGSIPLFITSSKNKKNNGHQF